MKKTHFYKNRINKKGIADNFIALIFVFIGLALVFGVLYLLMYAKMKASDAAVASDLNIKEGLYTTRIILNQELETDYKTYDAVIEYANGKNVDAKDELMYTIKKFYPGGIVTDKWLVIINNECFVITNKGVGSSVTAVQQGSPFGQGAGMSASIIIDECEKNIIDKMPKVTVPNPEGENLLVLFKPTSYLDGKTSRLFGYRADQLNGISEDSLPEYSFDGRNLVKIENIPNVECDASDTSVGKICIADANLVQQLRILSAEKLQKENMKLIITQAYRTYEIQKRLYNQNCPGQVCSTPTCNPDTSHTCPHMQAGAIDIILIDSSGRNINSRLNGIKGYNPQLAEDIMCQYGFVRYTPEDWHFEYGTNQWEIAMEKRANGEKACTY